MGFENGKVCVVRIRITAGDQEHVNTYHYDLDDTLGPDDNDPQSLADTFRDDVVPHYKPLYDASWTIQPVVVYQEKDPQNPTAPRSEWISGTTQAGTGTGTGDFLPQGVCTVVKLTTDHIGRRFRGRTFIGGNPHEGVQTNGTWTAEWLEAVDILMDAIPRQPDISPPGSDSTARWSVYSRTQRAADLDPYLSRVTAAVIGNRVRWLRSRQV